MDGTLHMIDGVPVLRFERKLAHPVERVWRTLTEPTEMSGWFPWQVELDARVGGRIGFTHPRDLATAPDAVITEWDPPRVFAYTWNGEPLRWELTEDAAGCVLVFTHGLAERPPAGKIAAGWHVSLDALDAALDGSQVRPGRWAEFHRRYVAAFGLLDGEIEGDKLRFEQELVFPVQVVWAALANGGLGEVGPNAEAVPNESITYPVPAGTVTMSLAPQQFGARLEVTRTGPAQTLATVRPLWRDKLVQFADELAKRHAAG
jgi:uncharacterized protein YndB with AHSA1/START domain